MRSAPKADHGFPRSLLKRFRARFRRDHEKTHAQLPFNPLGQHPVQPANKGTARIESDSSERGSARSDGSARSTQPAQSTRLEPFPAYLPDNVMPPPHIPEDRQQCGAGKPNTQVSDPAATPTTPPVPSSLLGQPAPGNRRQSSGWKSAETQVGDPDAITPAPPVEKKRMLMSSVSAGSTLLGSESKPENYPCHICGYVLDKPRGKNHKVERLAFLPCGQAFGHECLFHWLTDMGLSRYCPDCGVTMRHACEHLTVPTKFPPVKAFTNAKAAVMPWNYEFCESPKGLRLHTRIRTTTERLHRSEAKKANREKSAMNFAHDTVRKLYGRVAARAEKRLDVQHKAWWARRWASFAVVA